MVLNESSRARSRTSRLRCRTISTGEMTIRSLNISLPPTRNRGKSERIPGREPERVSCAFGHFGIFSILLACRRKSAALFSEDEDKVGASPVVVISDRLWQRAFNRDPSVIVARSICTIRISRSLSDAATNGIAARQRCVVFHSCGAEQTPGLDGRSHHPDDFRLGEAQSGDNCRSSAH